MLAVALAALLVPQSLQEAAGDFQAGRLRQAEAKLEAIARERPDSAEAHYYLGVIRFQTGRVAEARPLLERAVTLAPGRGMAWKVLGMVYAADGDLPLALDPFRKACELSPNDEDACYYLARNLYTLNRFEPALEAFQKAMAATPEAKLWRVHRGIAQALEALGRAAEAEEQFRRAIELNRGQARPDEDPRIDYGVFLFRQGRPEDALGPLEQAARESPSSARAPAELGRALLQLGRLDAAAAALEKAVQLDAKHWNAHLLLGRAYLRLGRKEEGERELRMGEQGRGMIPTVR